jgi:hypothetical protein
MYSTRTRISLAQFLDLQDQAFSALLLDKYEIGGLGVRYTTEVLQELASCGRGTLLGF